MATTDYGTDVSCTTDLDPYFTIVSGTTGLGQSLARRLQTPLGGLVDDVDYGYDLRAWINRPMGAKEIFEVEQRTVSECLKDERIQAAEATVTRTGSLLTVNLLVVAVTGQTFALVLAVSAVTVTVLQG